MVATRALKEGDGVQISEDPVLQRLRVSVRREVVAYLADLANAANPNLAAGAIAFNLLLNYPPNTVGSWLKSIVTGIGEGQPWADVPALLRDLEGQLPASALNPELRALVDLITSDVDTQGSVNARIYAETTARVADLQQEATDRASAIDSAVSAMALTLLSQIQAGDDAVNANVMSQAGASVDRDNAIAALVNTVTARLNAGGDVALSIAEAKNYAYTKAATDAAIAAFASALTTAFQAGDATLNTAITSASTASSDRDAAIGSRIDTITARLTTGGDIATSLATANTYAYTKAQTDAAISTASTALTSSLTGLINNVNGRLNAGGDIFNSLATANSYAYTKAATDSAISSSANALSSSFTSAMQGITNRLNAGGDIATSLANANNYAYTKAQSDTAIANTTSALTASINAVNGRLNAGGDVAISLATANSYAYTKAATDSAISAATTQLSASLTGSINGVNARLNNGGDIFTSLANANSYAYTKASTDSAIAGAVNTLRAEYQAGDRSISGQITDEAAIRAGADGTLFAQRVLKTVAQRSDGRLVFGAIGLASTASNDATGGQSTILLQADRIAFLASGDPNAAPKYLLDTGTVNGVPTLIISNAWIGDLAVKTANIDSLSVTTLKVADNAIMLPVGSFTAASMSTAFSTALVQTAVISVVDDGGGNAAKQKVIIMGGALITPAIFNTPGGSVSGTPTMRLLRNGTLLATGFPLPPYIDQPGAGTWTYTLEAGSSAPSGSNGNLGAGSVSNRSLILLGAKK